MNRIRLSFAFSLFVTLSPAVYAAASGVLPLFLDENNEAVALMGKEIRHPRNGGPAYTVWSDFGGKTDRNETSPQGALREFKEETGYYTFAHVTLNQIMNAPCATGDNGYDMYFLNLQQPKPTIQTIVNNAALARQNLGPNAHVEKTEWRYIKVAHLMDAINSNQIHNRQNWTMPETVDPVFYHMRGILAKPAAKTALTNFMNYAAGVRQVVHNLRQVLQPAPAPQPVPLISQPAPAPQPVSVLRPVLPLSRVQPFMGRQIVCPAPLQVVPASRILSTPLVRGPLVHTPHTPLFHSPVVRTSWVLSPLVRGPLVRTPHTPLFHSPVVRTSWVHSPLVRNPWVCNPVHPHLQNNLMMRRQIVHTPAIQSTPVGGNTVVHSVGKMPILNLKGIGVK